MPRGVDFAKEVEEQQIAREEELLILPRKEKTCDFAEEEELRIAQGKRQGLILPK